MRHLLDIPHLPLGAFEHCGDRKIKLHGPVSSAVSAVVDTASSVVNTVGNAVSNVANTVVDAGSSVVNAVANVAANTIDNVVTSAVSDPIGTAAKIGTAIVAPELLPAVNIADAIANGASPTQALEQGALAYGAAQLAPSVGADVASSTGSAALGSAAQGASTGATAALLSGKDPVTGALAGAVNAGANAELGSLVNSPSTSGGNTTSLPTVDTSPLDTSLTSNIPQSSGVQATPDTSSSLTNLATPSSSTGATLSNSANIGSMGGGQGATVTTDQGTTGALGTTAVDSSANLGNPNSIINNPSVLGTSVAPTDTTSKITLPKLNVAGALGIGATKPTTNAFTMPSSGLNFSTPTNNSQTSPFMQALTATPQFIKGNAIPQKAFSLAQLQQIYNNLDPELAKIIAPHGVINSTVQPEQAPETYQQYLEANDPSLLSSETKLMADGGSAFKTDVDPLAPKINVAQSAMLHPSGQHQMIKMAPLTQMSQGVGRLSPISQHLAHGGDLSKYHEAAPEGHHPEFITGLTGYYAHGKGTGQSDEIPAMLHDGDYVADADLVAALGDGSSKAGAQALDEFRKSIPHHMGAGGQPVPAQIADGEYVLPASFVTAIGHGDNKHGAKLLDKMREEVRAHKRSAPDTKIPPKAKSPLDYLKMAAKG